MSKEQKLFLFGGALMEAAPSCNCGKAGEKIAIFFTELASNGSIYLVENPGVYFVIIRHKNLGRLVAYEGNGEDRRWKMIESPIKEVSEEDLCPN